MAVIEATRPAQEEANGNWHIAISRTNPKTNAAGLPSVFLRVLCGEGLIGGCR